MSGETNGRIKLTVRDAVAWLLLFASILGAWYDTRGQIALMRQEIALRVAQSEVEHSRMWKAIDDAQAAPASRAKR